MSTMAPPPDGSSVIQMDARDPARRNPFFMAKEWLVWIIQSLLPRINQTATVVLAPSGNGGTYTDQNTAIGSTSLATGLLKAGTYRVTYEARVTTIDGVASSLTVSLGWTEDALALSLSGAPMVADSVSAPQTGSIMVTIDQNSALTFSTAYASTTPAKMKYKLRFVVESLTP